MIFVTAKDLPYKKRKQIGERKFESDYVIPKKLFFVALKGTIAECVIIMGDRTLFCGRNRI